MLLCIGTPEEHGAGQPTTAHSGDITAQNGDITARSGDITARNGDITAHQPMALQGGTQSHGNQTLERKKKRTKRKALKSK